MIEELEDGGKVYTGSLQQFIEESESEDIVPLVIAMKILGVTKMVVTNPEFDYEDVHLKATYIDDDSFELELLEDKGNV